MTQSAVNPASSDVLFRIVDISGDGVKDIAQGLTLGDIAWKNEGLIVKGSPVINVDRIYWKS